MIKAQVVEMSARRVIAKGFDAELKKCRDLRDEKALVNCVISRGVVDGESVFHKIPDGQVLSGQVVVAYEVNRDTVFRVTVDTNEKKVILGPVWNQGGE